MKKRQIIKKYIAVIEGVPKNKSGVINAPIRRESEDSVKRTVAPDGKEAITEYKIIEEHGDYSVAEVTLHTGRTHQIRLHFAYIGHPLKGDFLYGERNEDGYILRCNYLEFEHPITAETVKICI
jgi:23S rRNA pseudouridine1911/1915/1917 synthase